MQADSSAEFVDDGASVISNQSKALDTANGICGAQYYHEDTSGREASTTRFIEGNE